MRSPQLFTFNAFQENTYILFDVTRQAVIIDAGCYDPAEQQQLSRFVADNALEVQALLSTHSHVDHVLGNAFVKHTFGVKQYIHPLDEATLRSVKVYAPTYGFAQYEESEPDCFLHDGDIFRFGETRLQVLFVPGHAPGHIAFYDADNGYLIGGDVLFRESVGRTDLPGGDFETLRHSIQSRLYVLDEAIRVYPGHGPASTIGHEKRYNPFVKAL